MGKIHSKPLEIHAGSRELRFNVANVLSLSLSLSLNEAFDYRSLNESRVTFSCACTRERERERERDLGRVIAPIPSIESSFYLVTPARCR